MANTRERIERIQADLTEDAAFWQNTSAQDIHSAEAMIERLMKRLVALTNTVGVMVGATSAPARMVGFQASQPTDDAGLGSREQSFGGAAAGSVTFKPSPQPVYRAEGPYIFLSNQDLPFLRADELAGVEPPSKTRGKLHLIAEALNLHANVDTPQLTPRMLAWLRVAAQFVWDNEGEDGDHVPPMTGGEFAALMAILGGANPTGQLLADLAQLLKDDAGGYPRFTVAHGEDFDQLASRLQELAGTVDDEAEAADLARRQQQGETQ